MRVQLIYTHLNNPNATPPMGIIALGTFLTRNGVETRLYDLSFDRDLEGLAAELRSWQPQIVGVSSLTIGINTAFDVAKLAKELLPESKVVFGGPHTTALPAETLQQPNIDFVVIGEGEITLLDLVRTVEQGGDFSRVQGIGFKTGGQPVFTSPRPYIGNLDELGIPDRRLLPTFDKYLKVPPGFPYLMPWTYLIVGRGCPFNCSFCQPMLEKLFGNKVRIRSPKLVADEMELLIGQYRVKSIYFADDTFISNTAWVRELCAEIKKRGIHKKVVWMAQTNVNTLTAETAVLLKEAGCMFLAFGVESGNETILQEVMKKNQSREQIKKAFLICQKEGILTEAALIIGCAEDSVSSIQDTVTLVAEINPDIVDIHYMTPTPGSALYESYLQQGILDYKKWADPNRYTPGLLKMLNITRAELETMYEKVIGAYLKNKSLFRIKSHWFKWLWNLAVRGRNWERFYKLFLLQFLMLNSLTFNRLVKVAIRIKHAFIPKKAGI